MPENEFPKLQTHPSKLADERAPRVVPGLIDATAYVELEVTSNATFLTGASHPEELVESAARLGHRAAAITDTNTLGGIVRAHEAAKRAGIPLAVGCRLRFAAPSPCTLLAFPTCREAYSRLCTLLTLGKRRAPKGECLLTPADAASHAKDMLGVVVPVGPIDDDLREVIRLFREAFDGDRLSIAASRHYMQDDLERLGLLAELSRVSGVPLVATNDAHAHTPDRRPLQDVLTCVRHGCTIHEAGFRLHANAERHLKPGREMARLLAGVPGAIGRTIEIAERACAFNLDQMKYEYPIEACPPGRTPIEHLRDLASAGARRRYPLGVPEKVERALAHELALIEELRYEAYFITCEDIVSFARSRGILCQGRGGAANSALCFCLGITEVDPASFQLLFERFISRARGEPPDIDIDFEHERREEVIQYIYAKYGRERAALTAEVITYRGRSAVRDVGKAMGLSLDAIDTLARNLDRWGESADDARLREAGFNPSDPTMQRVVALSRELAGFPRHLSQHVGGFVITRTPLSELVPIENAAMEDRTVIEWDKDDIDAMGMLKIDILGLGMLTCIRKSFELIESAGGEALSISRVRTEHGEDPEVYTMIQHADTVGVFQIESRAQMSMLPRLRPACFYDLVIEVAIVRPGPIQGGMVHPYLRRRQGLEPVEYPSPQVEDVLGRTLGVPLFQEQAMQLAIVAAGFTPDEADGLRRAMAAWKRKSDLIYTFGQKIIAGMVERGYPSEFAHRCFEQIKGFSDYGFPESHAASFALLVYVSSWLKRHHPAAFAAALINSQPMGFYAPAQIVRDAKEHGVEVREVDVNKSDWDCSLERDPLAEPGHSPALRLGMRLVQGLTYVDAHRLIEARRAGGFASVGAMRSRSGISARGLRCLARADALRSLGLDRQEALWAIRSVRDEPAPLFEQIESQGAAAVIEAETLGLDALPDVEPGTQVLHDYAALGLSLKAHPMSFVRDRLVRRGVARCADLRNAAILPDKADVAVAGIVLVRQRPGTASGVVFITLEDETGIANLVIWSDTFEAYRKVARLSTILLAQGRVERQGEIVHLHARRLQCLDGLIPALASSSRDFH